MERVEGPFALDMIAAINKIYPKVCTLAITTNLLYWSWARFRLIVRLVGRTLRKLNTEERSQCQSMRGREGLTKLVRGSVDRHGDVLLRVGVAP
jgi:hypothetical protein